MDNQPYAVEPGEDPLDLAAYMRPEAQRFIVALGLIAEACNENEATARSMLGIALGLWQYKELEAAFLGERIGSLHRRMKAMIDLQVDPDPLAVEACDWMRSADKLNQRRDKVLHRPTWTGVVDGRSAQLLRRARREQQIEPLGLGHVQLVGELFDSVREGKDILVGYVTSEHPSTSQSRASGRAKLRFLTT